MVEADAGDRPVIRMAFDSSPGNISGAGPTGWPGRGMSFIPDRAPVARWDRLPIPLLVLDFWKAIQGSRINDLPWVGTIHRLNPTACEIAYKA